MIAMVVFGVSCVVAIIGVIAFGARQLNIDHYVYSLEISYPEYHKWRKDYPGLYADLVSASKVVDRLRDQLNCLDRTWVSVDKHKPKDDSLTTEVQAMRPRYEAVKSEYEEALRLFNVLKLTLRMKALTGENSSSHELEEIACRVLARAKVRADLEDETGNDTVQSKERLVTKHGVMV